MLHFKKNMVCLTIGLGCISNGLRDREDEIKHTQILAL